MLTLACNDSENWGHKDDLCVSSVVGVSLACHGTWFPSEEQLGARWRVYAPRDSERREVPPDT